MTDDTKPRTIADVEEEFSTLGELESAFADATLTFDEAPSTWENPRSTIAPEDARQ